MSESNERKNYFAEVKKKAAKSDNSSFAFILLLIGIIIVGTQVSGLHQELNLLKKEGIILKLLNRSQIFIVYSNP